jgi:hypothetical protein
MNSHEEEQGIPYGIPPTVTMVKTDKYIGYMIDAVLLCKHIKVWEHEKMKAISSKNLQTLTLSDVRFIEEMHDKLPKPSFMST